MDAVFTPRLGDGFKFNIGWVAAFGAVIVLDRLHLG